MDHRPVVRLEIEYADGETRRAIGSEADSIWRGLLFSQEWYHHKTNTVYQGPSLKTVQEARDGSNAEEEPGRPPLSLAELARRSRERILDEGRGGSWQGGSSNGGSVDPRRGIDERSAVDHRSVE